MATPTYTLIDSVTLGSSASSVTFSSIEQTFGDLILVSNHSTTGIAELSVRVNGDTSSNYYWVSMGGNGSTTVSQSSGGATNAMRPMERALTNTGIKGVFILQFFDYSATNKHKSVLSRSDTATYGTGATANRWGSTAAISSILLYPNMNLFESGSTFHLYGIAKEL